MTRFELDRRSVLRWGAVGAAATALPLGTAAATAAAPTDWSGEVSAQWRGAGDAKAPALATLSSMGPGAIPAGASVRVAVDASLVASLSLRAAQDFDGAAVVGATRESVEHGYRVLEWTLRQPLAAGRGVQLLLDAADGFASSAPAPSIVSLVTPAADPRQRPTGAEIAIG